MASATPSRSAAASEISAAQLSSSEKKDAKVVFSSSEQPQSTATVVKSFTEAVDPNENPFKMPPDNDIFLLRDKERQRKMQERLLQKNLKVQDKTTLAMRMNRRVAKLIDTRDSEEDGAADGVDDQTFTLELTRDRHVEKECLSDYINKKREMFLIQYSLSVKRDEMRKLEDIATLEEKKLELAEQYLEEDAALFDEFLKENDKSSGDAIKIAEAETKAKLEKVAEIKKLNAQMMSMRSEISKYEDTLREYQLYRQFLESLSPKAWLEERAKEHERRLEEKREKRSKKLEPVGPGSKADIGEKLSSQASLLKQSSSKISETVLDPGLRKASVEIAVSTGEEQAEKKEEEEDETEDDEEEPHLFFSDPQQLLDIFAELEEQNLTLIQNSQETEEALEEMKQLVKATKSKMEKETDILKEQINKLTVAITKEEDRAKELETKARMFSYGEFKSDDQEKLLAELNAKVEDVYRRCIGDNEANISTLQMLTNIENRLEELFQQIEVMPRDRVELAEKAKEKERRLRQREEKLEQQRVHQEERIRKALERAKAEPKKQTGRRLMPRSEPPQLKKHEDIDPDAITREEEEYAYYFLP